MGEVAVVAVVAVVGWRGIAIGPEDEATDIVYVCENTAVDKVTLWKVNRSESKERDINTGTLSETRGYV